MGEKIEQQFFLLGEKNRALIIFCKFFRREFIQLVKLIYDLFIDK